MTSPRSGHHDAPPPVFVDDSGRRLRHSRRIAVVAIVGCLGYALLLLFPAIGGSWDRDASLPPAHQAAGAPPQHADPTPATAPAGDTHREQVHFGEPAHAAPALATTSRSHTRSATAPSPSTHPTMTTDPTSPAAPSSIATPASNPTPTSETTPPSEPAPTSTPTPTTPPRSAPPSTSAPPSQTDPPSRVAPPSHSGPPSRPGPPSRTDPPSHPGPPSATPSHGHHTSAPGSTPRASRP